MVSERINIIVADDHPVFREGMAGALKRMKMISKISMATNGHEVIKLLEYFPYDLVFMDITMKTMDGIETTRIIQKQFPSVKVIALSMHDDARNVIGMFEKGASGYLLKNVGAEEIELAIQTVRNGEKYFSKEVSEVLLAHIGKHKSGNAVHEESSFHRQRIREIIFLISYELTSVEIGNAVSLATRTIDDYRKEILTMTNSRNTAGIVKYALANNIDQDMELRTKFKSSLVKKESRD